jgi:molybdopterin-containing oxidoreductase family iron-sulfur binding subunit
MQNNVKQQHPDNATAAVDPVDATSAAAAVAAVNDGAPLAALRSKLAGAQGKGYWKAFEQLAETAEFKTWIEDEFPNRESLLNLDRRNFLKIGGAALAMAGLTGCRILPETKAVPYVRAPEDIVAGLPLFYATALTRAGYAVGVLAESHEGRPTKIEGNPRHPASLGSTDVFEQAEVLNLYDPDRAQSVTYQGEPTSWDQFVAVGEDAMKKAAAAHGEGLRILTETVTSPTLANQMQVLLKTFPRARWHRYEPVGRENVYAGTRLAFGKPLNPVYRLSGAAVVVSLDADFFKTLPGNIRYMRDFADGRRVRRTSRTMNRLYAFDSSYTITGVTADHRFPIKPSEVEPLARALYGRLTGEGTDAPPASVASGILDAIVADLKANPGAAVVIPGEEATPAVHALAHAMNAALGAAGKTVYYTDPVEANPEDGIASIKALAQDCSAGKVTTLLILGGNPVYTAPADLNFGAALVGEDGIKKVPLVIRHGLFEDETSAYADWHIAESHALESWGDARAFDGTISIQQPLIQPLYDTRSAAELIASLLGAPQAGYDMVREWHQAHTYTAAPGALAFDRWFQTLLFNGVVPNSALPEVNATPAAGLLASLPAPAAGGAPADDLEINLRLDPHIWDGRYANNSWLQELPKPITTLTWDNAAIVSPKTAQAFGVISADNQLSVEDPDAQDIAHSNGKKVVELTVGSRKVSLPVYILPGHPDSVVTAYLGFGRKKGRNPDFGNVWANQGFDTYALRTTDNLSYVPGAHAQLTGDEYPLSYTQAHHILFGVHEPENRNVVHAGTFDQFLKDQNSIGVIGFDGDAEKPEDAGPPIVGDDGNPNMGPASSQGQTYEADPYRHMWEYADKSQSNREGVPSLYPEYSGKDFNQWAMTVDMTVCTGCNACVIACQAENNIPTVGKEQVGRARQMHWIRIDHYFSGPDLTNVNSVFMPMYCQQCEKAPCEPVCPVAATIHSHEGLNQMVYNRCIGTRYCSNNCPYKVRRFNFLKWTAGKGGAATVNYDLPVIKNLANPDVTVRGRGVMEKCMYCVQRINAARINAKKKFREIQDGDIVTACQQACPAGVFSFGDINDPNSVVSQIRNEPHNYSVLAELNTRPRTTYLARIKNPNQAIASLVGQTAAEPAGA